MKTKFTLLFTVLLFAGFTAFYGCEEIYEPITITGQVVESNSQSPVSNATVSIVSPEDLARETISDGSGNYIFEEVAVDSVIDLTIRAEKEGFSTESVTVLAAPERELTVPDLRIADRQRDEGDDIASPVGGAASIILVNLSSQSIRITETGGEVNSSFTFEVQDSSGRAIDANHAVDVEFEITEGPGGGETITPTVVRSDANGLVSSNIFAGNVAGNLKIQATIERPEVGLTVRSKPILLTIHGGFPDLAHFSIAADIYNFEAYNINGNRDEITVIVGDKFSNPVKEGTPVYFNTTHGVIQGSGVTNPDGEVTVDLISGDPRPPRSNAYATIRAYTFDENDNEISRQIPVLFSGPPSGVKIQVTPSTFNIGPGGSQEFTMVITDVNDNPLPFNTRITVTPSDGMTVDGQVNVTVPNALNSDTPSETGTTRFVFTAQDSDDESSDSQKVGILIEVETPGGYTASKTITGSKAKAF